LPLPEKLEIMLINASGQLVMTKILSDVLTGSEIINLLGMAKGMYILRVVGSEKGFVGKVMR